MVITKIINRILFLVLVCLITLLSYKTFRTPYSTESPILSSAVANDVNMNNNLGDSTARLDCSEDLKSKVDPMIKDYIVNNPEIIMASLEQLDHSSNQETPTSDSIEVSRQDLEDASNVPSMGNNSGDVTVVVFYDYSCVYCKKSVNYLDSLLASDKGIKIVFRALPILGEVSDYAARISLAVYALFPEKFQAIHHAIMHIESFDVESINSIIVNNGLNAQDILVKAESNEIKQIVNNNVNLAVRLKAQGVPTYVINGKLMHGLTHGSKFDNAIKAARASI